ncbi:hypothetical protein [Dysgonomonas sp. 511]|uniref:hypothetical protein n=1 Tax=Dysgonomonas sp. 511 TaxID=2302930 RepID=UPI0013D36DB1|nr:hypothetical protein [Dysgonomonas sp. 511]NDV78395.1 hypothetical protein [Dysgonomonas sp. 511]
MLSRGIKKYISNPVIGLLPFVLFVILRLFGMTVGTCLVVSLVFAIAGDTILKFYNKTREPNVTFYISIISIIITLIVWFFTNKILTHQFTYIVILEAMIVCLFMLLRASQTYITIHFFRKKSLLQKTLLKEFFDSSVLIQYGLTLHIFSILLYRQFRLYAENIHFYDIVIFAIVPALIIIVIGVYHMLKIRYQAGKLRNEEWLPIVNEKGEVTGKIAKSVSLNMKNRFLHPVVRVALVSNSKIYLQPRPQSDILDPGKLDYPFEKYMLYSHEINLAARNSIHRMIGSDIDFNLKFILKYVFDNDNTKRLIFLFVAYVDDEHSIKREGGINGKFWSIKQMEEGFADDIFSECFQLEFEYLKNMVLEPTDIMRKPLA